MIDDHKIRMLLRCLLASGTALVPTLNIPTIVHAQEAPPADEIGHCARSLLALQVSGGEAGPSQSMLGAEAGAAYARYLKSFDTPIPAHFGSAVGDVGGTNSGSAGAGGQN